MYFIIYEREFKMNPKNTPETKLFGRENLVIRNLCEWVYSLYTHTHTSESSAMFYKSKIETLKDNTHTQHKLQIIIIIYNNNKI